MQGASLAKEQPGLHHSISQQHESNRYARHGNGSEMARRWPVLHCELHRACCSAAPWPVPSPEALRGPNSIWAGKRQSFQSSTSLSTCPTNSAHPGKQKLHLVRRCVVSGLTEEGHGLVVMCVRSALSLTLTVLGLCGMWSKFAEARTRPAASSARRGFRNANWPRAWYSDGQYCPHEYVHLT